MAEGGRQQIQQPIINLNVYLVPETDSLRTTENKFRIEKVTEQPAKRESCEQFGQEQLHGGNFNDVEITQTNPDPGDLEFEKRFKSSEQVMDAVLELLRRTRMIQAEAKAKQAEGSVTSLQNASSIPRFSANMNTHISEDPLGLHGTPCPVTSFRSGFASPPPQDSDSIRSEKNKSREGKLPGRAVPISNDERKNDLIPSDILEALGQAENCLQQGERCVAMTVISNITKRMMTSSTGMCHEIKAAAEKFRTSHPIQSLILLRILSRVYLMSKSPEDAISRIRDDCMLKSCEIVIAISKGIKGRVSASEIGIPFIREILNDVRGLEGCTISLKVEKEAICLNDVGNTYRKIGKPEIGVEYATEGVEIMNRYFGSTAPKYRIVGLLLNAIGEANEDMGNFKEADEYFRMAIASRDRRSRFK